MRSRTNQLFIVLLFLLPVCLSAQGSLLLVGGGSEDYNGWSDAPYGWFVAQADSGKIINIDVDEASDWYSGYFGVLGADESGHKLRIPDRNIANDSTVYNELVSARGIFIEGGDQWDYVQTWKGTLVEDAINQVFLNGGAIGGTSAGLAILGEIVFDAKYGTAYPDYAAYNPYYNRLHFEDDFLEMLPGVLTDTHFQERGRIGRMVPMLARRIVDFQEPDITGIGVDAQTAFCIDENHVGTAYGNTVTILYKDADSEIDLTENEPLSFTNIHFDQLLTGAVYNLQTHQLIEPGDYLSEVNVSSEPEEYTAMTLSGSDTAIAGFGEFQVDNIYGNPEAWRQGDLTLSGGSAIIPGTVIMPKIWNLDPDVSDDYFSNRIVGAQFALAMHPGLTAIYLDDHSHLTISSAGVATTDTLAYILDTRDLSYVGVNENNNPGLIGTRLHYLGPGDQYDLKDGSAVGILDPDFHKPKKFGLLQNYPNPFNNSTQFQYQLPEDGLVRLNIYDINGRFIDCLLDQNLSAGNYTANWNSASVSSGIYFAVLQTPSRVHTQKCILLK